MQTVCVMPYFVFTNKQHFSLLCGDYELDCVTRPADDAMYPNKLRLIYRR